MHDFAARSARTAPIGLLLMGAVFPYGWLATVSPAFFRVLYGIFPTGDTHVYGHIVGFAVVGAILLIALPRLQHKAPLFLGLILVLGLSQETFQLSYKSQASSADFVGDVGVDVLTAAMVWAVMKTFKRT